MQTALVFTGATTPQVRAGWQGQHPDLVFPSVVECVDWVIQQQAYEPNVK